MNRLQYRRFSDGHESLVANHTVGVGSGNSQAAIRWYEIRNLSTTPTIYQQSTYAPDTDNRWMGSMAMDQAGDIALGYSVSSGTISPSIRYTGRLAGDPLGTLPQGEAILIAGAGSQTSSLNRWGDYSMMAVDPTDDCTFWYTQEYYATTSSAGWQTRIGSFKFQSCGSQYVVGAVGSDRALWVFRNGSGFSSLGGIVNAAPAIAAVPQANGSSIPLYIATGSDNNLWVRNDSRGWQPLMDNPVSCVDNPAAVVIGATLYVACQGADHSLYHVEGSAPAGDGLPRLSTAAFHTLGGILVAGPAVASVSGTPTYFVIGADQHVYSRTLSAGYSEYQWMCVGHPSVATAGSSSYFACDGSSDGSLWYATNSGTGWSPIRSLGGGLSDGTGIAATANGPIYFVHGSDNAVWHRTSTSGWTVDGGVVRFGVAATSL
jgi:hypothetical protein